MIGRPIALLSSKRSLIWLVGGWVLYYVTRAVWSREAFAETVYGLDANPLFQAFFALFLLSALLNFLRAAGERYREGKARFLLWAFLPAGTLVFLLGFFMSASLREYEQALVGDGDVLKPVWQERAYRVARVEPSLKEEILDVQREAGPGIFAYEPKVMVETPGGVLEVGAFPPRKIGGTYYHILQFGLAPGVRLMKDGETLAEGYMALRLLPPGSEDSFEIPPHPYRFLVRLTHEKVIERGRTRAKLYRLRPPRYLLTVLKGGEIIYRGGGDDVSFDGLGFSFREPTYWALLEMSSNPGLPVLVLGVGLLALGLPLRLLHAAHWLLRGRGRGK
jgi:hypothetical protein